jgi:hypothetical protein
MSKMGWKTGRLGWKSSDPCLIRYQPSMVGLVPTTHAAAKLSLSFNR